MDEVRTVTFPKPVATVYVGNPAIADINMIDSRHAFVLGKGSAAPTSWRWISDGKQVFEHAMSASWRAKMPPSTLHRGASASPIAAPPAIARRQPQPGDSKECSMPPIGQIAAHQDAAKRRRGRNQA